MKKCLIKNLWLVIVSILSITAICLVICRIDPISYDYMAILVGILSILVTILIGWQIWSTIAIDSRIKGAISSAKKEIGDYLESENNRRDDLSMYTLCITHARIAIIEKDYEDAFVCFIRGLEHTKNLELKSELIEQCLSPLYSMVNELEKIGETFPIEINRKDEFINILRDVRDDRTIYLINYIRSQLEALKN